MPYTSISIPTKDLKQYPNLGPLFRASYYPRDNSGASFYVDKKNVYIKVFTDIKYISVEALRDYCNEYLQYHQAIMEVECYDDYGSPNCSVQLEGYKLLNEAQTEEFRALDKIDAAKKKEAAAERNKVELERARKLLKEAGEL